MVEIDSKTFLYEVRINSLQNERDELIQQRDSLEARIATLNERVNLLEEALAPFAACNPTKLGSIPDDQTWLWKPCDSSNPNTDGISRANIMRAKQVLAIPTKP